MGFKTSLPFNRKKSLLVYLFLPAIILTATLILQGCGAKKSPNLERIFAPAREQKGKRPVIFIPGFIGTELIDSRTGKKVWPTLLRKSDDIDLPIRPDFLNSKDNLVPGNVIDSVRLIPLLPKIDIFKGLFVALEQYAGYKRGDWENPASDGDRDTYYLFAYDWRRDQVESARLLLQNIAKLKQKLGRADLKFNVITISGGGTIARYAAMYGDKELPDDIGELKVTWAGAEHIKNIFMYGSPNEGTIDMFSVLEKHYSWTQGLHKRRRILNKLSREDAFSSPAVIQLLPFGGTFTFLNQDLQPINIDFYDPETWKKYGWSSAFDEKYRREFEKKQNRPLADLDAYLIAILKRTKNFHEALRVRTESSPVSYYALGADCEESLNSPVIIFDEKRKRWKTLVEPKEIRGSDGRVIPKEKVTEKMYAPGDGRVTRHSMLAQTNEAKERVSALYPSKLPLKYVAFGCGTHGLLHANKFILDNTFTLLLNELMN